MKKVEVRIEDKIQEFLSLPESSRLSQKVPLNTHKATSYSILATHAFPLVYNYTKEIYFSVSRDKSFQPTETYQAMHISCIQI